jgi:hypothetical protein
MKLNHFILFIALSAVSCLYAACKSCQEQVEDIVEYGMSFTILDKTTRKNQLDYTVGSWVDSIRIKEVKTQKTVGLAPTPEGTLRFTYYDEKTDKDAFNSTLHKQFMLNLKNSRDTFDVYFKMKHGECRDLLETMEVLYTGKSYNVSIINHSFTLLK